MLPLVSPECSVSVLYIWYSIIVSPTLFNVNSGFITVSKCYCIIATATGGYENAIVFMRLKTL